jgi:hypothetical protein
MFSSILKFSLLAVLLSGAEAAAIKHDEQHSVLAPHKASKHTGGMSRLLTPLESGSGDFSYGDGAICDAAQMGALMGALSTSCLTTLQEVMAGKGSRETHMPPLCACMKPLTMPDCKAQEGAPMFPSFQAMCVQAFP